MNASHKIASIINFCSNEYPFLKWCIAGIKSFSSQIVIPVCDHFFDGMPEKRSVLNGIYAEHPDVAFVEFPYHIESSYASHSISYWHNLARLLGRFFLREEIEYVLFLDCDEIMEAKEFGQWLDQFSYRDFDAISLANYWYFRDACFQALTWESTPLLVRKQLCCGKLLMRENERLGIFKAIAGKKNAKVLGLDFKPMIHHYSWVRTKDQMLRKVQSWGHHKDTNWQEKVEKEFSHPFSGKDFVHEYAFIQVLPRHSIDLTAAPQENENASFPHLYRLTEKEIRTIDLALTFDLPLTLSTLP